MMRFKLVEYPNQSVMVDINIIEARIFADFEEAWEIPNGVDRATLMENVKEYARLQTLYEWQEHYKEDHGEDEDDLACWTLIRWIQQHGVLQRLDALNDYFSVNNFVVRIHLPLPVIQQFESSKSLVMRMLSRCDFVTTLHTLDAFAEIVRTRDEYCLKEVSTMTMKFLDGVREWALVANRGPVTDAVRLSDFVRLNIFGRIREVRGILFQ